LVSSWREIRLIGAREFDPSASCMYDRISRTYIRPFPSNVTPTGLWTSGSLSTGAMEKPAGSRKRFCCSCGVSRTTGGFSLKSAPWAIIASRPPRPPGGAAGGVCGAGDVAGA
jgi:hypothetical protein